MAICVLSHNQVKQFYRTGVRPSCAFHKHLKYLEARKLVSESSAVSYLDEFRAIVIFDCVQRYYFRGKRSGPVTTMQLTPIPHGKLRKEMATNAER